MKVLTWFYVKNAAGQYLGEEEETRRYLDQIDSTCLFDSLEFAVWIAELYEGTVYKAGIVLKEEE